MRRVWNQGGRREIMAHKGFVLGYGNVKRWLCGRLFRKKDERTTLVFSL